MKKLLLSIMAVAGMAFTANADYYLVGGFNEWTNGDPAYVFTDQNDGTYVLNMNGTLASGFKVTNGTWDNDNTWGGTKDSPLTVGVAYTLSQPGDNIELTENILNPKIIFDPDNSTLLIVGEEVEAEYIYKIKGTILGDPDWGSYVMTEVGGKWVLSDENFIVGNFGIQKVDKSTDSQVEWINSADEDSTVILDQNMNCQVEGNNFYLGEGGAYVIVFDPDAMTLLVSTDPDAGVSSIGSEISGEEVIYNLQGVRVNRQNATPGIYIVNGKKTVIR